jgi:hypothetical protein
MQSQRPKCVHGVNAVVWRMAVSGLCASLVGIGLSRFAYTPVLPELIAAVVILAVYADPVSLTVSSRIVGAFVPGIVPLGLGRVHELVPENAARQKAAWGLCATACALGQALGGYGLCEIFARTGDGCRLLFMGGAAALFLCCATEIVMAALGSPLEAVSADTV